MKKLAETPTADQLREALAGAPMSVTDEPTRIQQALESGKWGALVGGGLGALRAALNKPDESGSKGYLRNTLAGALLGGLGAGGTKYLTTADPFTQASGPAQGFERAKSKALAGLLTPGKSTPDVARESIFSGLLEMFSGKHDFGPEEQKALVSQFVKSKVPTGKGWRNRVQLAEDAVNKLQVDPKGALPALTTLQKVAPDPEMKMLAGDAIARLRTGRASTTEGINAMASLARSMNDRLRIYRAATKTLDSLNVMKEMYGAGQLTDEDVAKNVGLVTGRFGAKTPKAVALRQLVQEALAHNVPADTPSPYPDTEDKGKDIGSLIARALRS